MARRTLPLGIDIGTVRTRAALLERSTDGSTHLLAVATKPTGDDAAAAVIDAVAELSTREKRCVLAIGPPVSRLRGVTFPPLSARERQRAARFEAARGIDFPIDEAAVRIVPIDATTCLLAVAPQRIVDARSAVARAAKLRPIAIDDAAFAMLRCVAHGAAVLDIGLAASVLVVGDDPAPIVHVFPIGGQTFTDAIARALGLDDRAAERRKLTVGLAGAGEATRDALVAHIAAAILSARSRARAPIHRLALAGNGSRLVGLLPSLEAALGMPVASLELPADASLPAPTDVVRAAAPDWALAYGLALRAAA